MQKNGGGAACASCKHQRKRCSKECILAPHFPADKAEQFNAVQKVFGVSNITKMLKAKENLEDRQRIAETLIWEAECRQADAVLGPYGEYQKIFEKQQRLEEILIKRNANAPVLNNSFFTQNSVQNNSINHHHQYQSTFHENNVSSLYVSTVVPSLQQPEIESVMNYQVCNGRSHVVPTQVGQSPVSAVSYLHVSDGREMYGQQLHNRFLHGQGHPYNVDHQKGNNQEFQCGFTMVFNLCTVDDLSDTVLKDIELK
ncbi:hypothetical protein J5N97_007754 [Dioscorea zingiberensis]|uniref:LOB domain-containing protein n=1 Tax=Dioscorea zingiberensis TaxID=325984 RepID=A0A9D5DCG7_9LILI|nr:hypothetical protein J5N97_007754 [Dioscorea zingiberensis]